MSEAQGYGNLYSGVKAYCRCKEGRGDEGRGEHANLNTPHATGWHFSFFFLLFLFGVVLVGEDPGLSKACQRDVLLGEDPGLSEACQRDTAAAGRGA